VEPTLPTMLLRLKRATREEISDGRRILGYYISVVEAFMSIYSAAVWLVAVAGVRVLVPVDCG